MNPDSPDAPKYWQYETGGQLGPAMERYLLERPLSGDDIGLIQAYLRQWIDSPAWDANPAMGTGERLRLGALRLAARHSLRTRKQIHEWLERALDMGIDPL